MSAYNAEKHIEEAIISIINQSYEDFEFIIVNDGSTDKTLSIIKKYANLDKRIRLINQNNIGLTKTLIKLVDMAKGKYIARMDADDISHEKRLLLQVDYLDKNQNTAVIGSWVNIINKRGEIDRKKKLTTSRKKIKKRIIYGNQLVHGSVTFRKDIYNIVGGYDSNFRYSQDYELWLRITKKANIANYPSYLYSLRVHKDSISSKNLKSQLDFAVNAVLKNICHQKIQSKISLFKSKCGCIICKNDSKKNNIEIIKRIVYARILLRMGDYNRSALYYSKIKNLEGRIMTLFLKSKRTMYFIKKIYFILNKL